MMLKKVSSFLLVAVLLVYAVAPMSVSAVANTPLLLSDFSDQSLIDYLIEQGLPMPEDPEDQVACLPFVRRIIMYVEENPDLIFPYNHPAILERCEEIRGVTRAYYSSKPMARELIYSSQNILQDNTVHGSWNIVYIFYNCYAYVLGQTDSISPGYTEDIDFDETQSIQQIAELVEGDLENLGYTILWSSQTMPTIAVTDYMHTICIRKDSDGIWNDGKMVYDYHCMKKGTDGAWYHKPGGTNPLRYKYTPANNLAWVHEAYSGMDNTYYRNDDMTYDSDIVFISYCAHSWGYRYCCTQGVDNYHLKRCIQCNIVNGSHLPCIYKGGSNVCFSCGQMKFGSKANNSGFHEAYVFDCPLQYVQ